MHLGEQHLERPHANCFHNIQRDFPSKKRATPNALKFSNIFAACSSLVQQLPKFLEKEVSFPMRFAEPLYIVMYWVSKLKYRFPEPCRHSGIAAVDASKITKAAAPEILTLKSKRLRMQQGIWINMSKWLMACIIVYIEVVCKIPPTLHLIKLLFKRFSHLLIIILSHYYCQIHIFTTSAKKTWKICFKGFTAIFTDIAKMLAPGPSMEVHTIRRPF